MKFFRSLVKYFVNIVFSLFQKRPKKVFEFNFNNAYLLEKFNNTKVSGEAFDEGIIDLIPTCLDEDKIYHFQSFKSLVNYSLIDTSNENFQFNRNFCLDPSYDVIYQEGISLSQLPICHQFLKEPKFINGTIAYLSNSNVNNFGHWVQYTLPLLHFYWKEVGKENIDYYYIGDTDVRKFQIESLKYLGVNQNQIINYSCKGSRILCCIKSNPVQFNYASFNDSISFKFLRNILTNMGNINDGNSPKKIYVKRGEVKYRKVIEEEWIIDFLNDNGYVICSMDGLSLKEQAGLFYNASEIIAPHGSALTNIMFCKPNTKLLELFPFNYPDWFNVSFAAHAQLNYFYLFGKQANTPANEPIYNDILIDKEKFIHFYNLKFVK